MKVLAVEDVLDRKERPWFAVLELGIDRRGAAEWFGCEPHVAWMDGMGDADYWGVEFECGLKVVFEFLHCGRGARVLATEPVAQHVERHLKHWSDQLRRLPPQMFEGDRKEMIALFAETMPELREVASFQLWRQGDDGNEMKVGDPTSRLDAECWQSELESHKHKQTYWVTKIR